MEARVADRGAVAVLAVFFILVMGGFLALSFNLGLLMKARGELQGASDSAALAAAESLDGTAAGLRSGRRIARAFAAAHNVTGESVRIDRNADVHYGFWHFRAEPCVFGSGGCPQGFELSPDPNDNPFSITAVEVVNGRDNDRRHNRALRLVFGAFLDDQRSLTIRSQAVAVGRRGRVDCALPVGICADALLDDGELRCDGGPPRRMVFSSENQEDLAWVNLLDDSSPNPPTVRQQILHNQELCEANDFQTGSFRYNNGNNLQPVIDAFLGFDQDDQQGPCLIGQTRTSPVIECSRGGGNRRMVIGFVNVEIEALTCASGRLIDSCPTAGRGNVCSSGGGRGGGSGGGREAVSLRIACDSPVGPTGGPGLKLRLVH
jgi:putative Flp pilus-assembly TadE/G-like protein